MYVIGVDPGPIPGVIRLQLIVDALGQQPSRLIGAEALQVTPGMLLTVIDGICADTLSAAIGLERFVVGRRAARSATAAAGQRTRDMVGAVEAWAQARRVPVHTRAAAEVKPWAVDKRLYAAGLLDITAGMRHARDAARHALFCAVKDYGLPDPLSRKAAA